MSTIPNEDADYGTAPVSTLIAGGVIALAGLVQIFWENVLPIRIRNLRSASCAPALIVAPARVKLR